ncbi:NAD(P)/FAD-dependent oxidoreductase [Pseudanabaena biceps]|nr:NAD(P)/FAD-dependent oxidoreductase [Pseudanabaena biceps]
MSVDYDLVVIGMGAYAQTLVTSAAKLEARIAWVCELEIGDRSVNHTALNTKQVHDALISLQGKLKDYSRQERFTKFSKEISTVLGSFEQLEILEMMSSMGVDVILGKPRFQGKFKNKPNNPPLLEISQSIKSKLTGEIEQVIHRQISARAYAIADDVSALKQNIFGLAQCDYLTVPQLLHLPELPKAIALIGDDPYSCELAQAINFFGVKTLLITKHLHILPNVDVAIARTLQAQLEAEGVEIYTRSKVTAVSKEGAHTKIWLERHTIDCDYLLLTNPPDPLQLPKDPHIYQCRSPQDVVHIIQITLPTRLTLGLMNFWKSPLAKTIPEIVYVQTSPPLAQVGLMELPSSKSICVLESASGEMDLCRVICDRQGYILGASMVGNHARLVIDTIAIAMQGKIKVQELAPNLGIEINLKLAKQWQEQRLQRSDRLKLREWFTFCRDWNF